MLTSIQRTLSFTRAWLRPPRDVIEEEVTVDRDGTAVRATLVRPSITASDLPAWVVMHGITRPGRSHTQLVRFTRALARAGIAAIVPDVPEWRDLQLRPDLSVPSIAASVRWLRDSELIRDEPVGVVGFSFGAPHAVGARASPRLRDEIGAACGFGGYCSLRHTFRFMMTGRYNAAGEEAYLKPDPYGRWIVAANYLTAVPGYEDATDVAEALRTLACHAGDIGATSWHALYDPIIHDLRGIIAMERRGLFDVFAPGSKAHAPRPEAFRIGEQLEEAARLTDPTLDPSSVLGAVRGTVHLLHGRVDHLIPYSESQRMAKALRVASPRLTITRLFNHSAQETIPTWRSVVEIPRFGRALGSVFSEL